LPNYVLGGSVSKKKGENLQKSRKKGDTFQQQTNLDISRAGDFTGPKKRKKRGGGEQTSKGGKLRWAAGRFEEKKKEPFFIPRKKPHFNGELVFKT